MNSYKVAGVVIDFETKPDLFSPKALDMGSELLISCLPKVISTRVEEPNSSSLPQRWARDDNFTALDWGCGWGALGLWLAKYNPKAKVTALDSDIAAVKATQENANTNRIFNLQVLASHSYDELPAGHTFDLIISNPPTHRGREVIEQMIEVSKERLNSGGVIVLVVEARIKPWVARQLKATFGDYKIVKRSRKHVVVIAVN